MKLNKFTDLDSIQLGNYIKNNEKVLWIYSKNGILSVGKVETLVRHGSVWHFSYVWTQVHFAQLSKVPNAVAFSIKRTYKFEMKVLDSSTLFVTPNTCRWLYHIAPIWCALFVELDSTCYEHNWKVKNGRSKSWCDVTCWANPHYKNKKKAIFGKQVYCDPYFLKVI